MLVGLIISHTVGYERSVNFFIPSEGCRRCPVVKINPPTPIAWAFIIYSLLTVHSQTPTFSNVE